MQELQIHKHIYTDADFDEIGYTAQTLESVKLATDLAQSKGFMLRILNSRRSAACYLIGYSWFDDTNRDINDTIGMKISVHVDSQILSRRNLDAEVFVRWYATNLLNNLLKGK